MTIPESYHRDMNAARRLRELSTDLRQLAKQVDELADYSQACRLAGIHGKEIDGAADTLIIFAEGVEALASERNGR